MFFLRKVILAITAFILVLWGGASTQTNSLMLQGGGLVGLIAGIVILFIFGRMALRAMGLIPALIIIFGIISFIIYAIGGFRGGIENLGDNLKNFLGQQGKAIPAIENFAENTMEKTSAEKTSEGQASKDETSEAEVSQEDTLMNSNLVAEEAQNTQAASNIPQIQSPARVLTADTLEINGIRMQLYGIDAPEMNQSCANAKGRSYRCGQEAANWLKGWITGYNLDCQIMGRAANGNYVGVCSLGDYDLGAALVNAGWAVANREESEVYVPYEDEARTKRNGLWSGRFYKPKDWREYMQQGQ